MTWPTHCQVPSSCEQNQRCMMAGCVHAGRALSVTEIMEAAKNMQPLYGEFDDMEGEPVETERDMHENDVKAERAAAGIDWQPIETAALNMDPRLLYTRGPTQHTGSYWIGAWDGDWFEDVEMRLIRPTHWAALNPPKPPCP